MKTLFIYSRIPDKSRLILLLATAFAILSSFTSNILADTLLPNLPNFRTSAASVETPRFTLATELPKLPGKIPLVGTYTLDAEEYILELATVFELESEVARNGKGKLALRYLGGKPMQQTLTMFEASAGFFYRYDNLLNAIPESQPRLPSNRRAMRIARGYLQAHGLMRDDLAFEKTSFSRPKLSEFSAKTGKTIRQFHTALEVRFEQEWNGIPVTGPGAKLYVAIGDGGRVVGLTSTLREGRNSETTLTVLPPEEALKNLMKGVAKLSVPLGCLDAQIEAIQLAYWSESPKNRQRTSVPLYAMSGPCYGKNGRDLGGFEAYTAGVLEPDSFPRAEPRFIDYEQDVDE